MTPPKRKEKKSESLDVRLPYSVKQNFMAACQLRNETASAAVRRFIDGYIAESQSVAEPAHKANIAATFARNPLKSLRLAASAALAAFAITALPATASQRVFAALDITEAGGVTLGEISSGHQYEAGNSVDANVLETSPQHDFQLTAKGTLMQPSQDSSGRYLLTFTEIDVDMPEDIPHIATRA